MFAQAGMRLLLPLSGIFVPLVSANYPLDCSWSLLLVVLIFVLLSVELYSQASSNSRSVEVVSVSTSGSCGFLTVNQTAIPVLWNGIIMLVTVSFLLNLRLCTSLSLYLMSIVRGFGQSWLSPIPSYLASSTSPYSWNVYSYKTVYVEAEWFYCAAGESLVPWAYLSNNYARRSSFLLSVEGATFSNPANCIVGLSADCWSFIHVMNTTDSFYSETTIKLDFY